METCKNGELIPVVTRKTFYEGKVAVCDVPNINATGKEDMVICYGDFLTSGITPPGEAYPAFLQELLKVKVYNHGNTDSLYTDALKGLEEKVMDYNPRMVILQFGTNDGWIGRTAEEVRRELEQLLKACMDAGIITILIGMAPPPSPDFFSIVETYSVMYIETCKKLGIPLMDAECFVGGTFVPRMGIPDTLKYDGPALENSRLGYIAPNSYNAKGNKVLAQNVFTCLEPLFEELKYIK